VAYGDSIFSSSQFLLLLQLPQKIFLALEVVKFDSKLTALLPQLGKFASQNIVGSTGEIFAFYLTNFGSLDLLCVA
jgi:hypothetical protein